MSECIVDKKRQTASECGTEQDNYGFNELILKQDTKSFSSLEHGEFLDLKNYKTTRPKVKVILLNMRV